MADNSEVIEANVKEIGALKDQLVDMRQSFGAMKKASSGDEVANVKLKACKLLQGHFGKIYAMDWGADDTSVLSAAQDGSLILWNAMTLNKRQMINLRSSWVMSCAVSPSGKMTASGGLDNICTIYKLPADHEDEPRTEIKAHQELLEHAGYLSGAVFLDDQKVVTSAGDATCILWDIEGGKYERVFKGHESDVMDVSLIPHSDLFVSGSCDMTCKVWDYRDAKANVLTFPGHETDVNAVDASRSGNYFCSASDASRIILHDLRSYGPLADYHGDNDVAPITSAAFSSTSRLIFAGYDDSVALVWDTLKGEKVDTLDQHANRVSCLGVNSSGTAMCTGGWDVFLRVWA